MIADSQTNRAAVSEVFGNKHRVTRILYQGINSYNNAWRYIYNMNIYSYAIYIYMSIHSIHIAHGKRAVTMTIYVML